MQLKISKYIDDHAGEMISCLSSLVAIPSVKGEPEEGMPFGKEPARALEKMLQLGEKYGFTVKNHENYVGTIDMYAGGNPALGILCHLDVVPEGTGWTNPPYTMTLSGGKLYGRGVSDDKGPAVAVLFAMRALRECGYQLSKNVRFLVGTDEECGSSDLAYYRTKEVLPPNVFTPDASYPVINIEKGRASGTITGKFDSEGEKVIVSANGGVAVNAVPDRAYATLKGFTTEEVAVAAKRLPTGIIYETEKTPEGLLKITIKGKAAHASAPQNGNNAVTALFLLLGGLHTEDVSSKFFALISTVFRYGEFDGTSMGIKASDEKSGALTFAFSKFNYELGDFEGNFDIRFPICENCDSIREKLEKKLDSVGLTLSTFKGVEPHYVDEESEFIQTLLSVYNEMTHKKAYCMAIGGGTYVHGIEGGVAFGAEFLGEDNHVHGADEWVSLNNLLLNAKIFAEVILRLCE